MTFKRYGTSIYRTQRWKAVRLQAKRRDDWRCIQCGSRVGLEVDHIRPLRDYPAGAYELANLQTLCGRCHGKKTRREIGLPPPDPERTEWLKAVAKLQKRID